MYDSPRGYVVPAVVDALWRSKRDGAFCFTSLPAHGLQRTAYGGEAGGS